MQSTKFLQNAQASLVQHPKAIGSVCHHTIVNRPHKGSRKALSSGAQRAKCFLVACSQAGADSAPRIKGAEYVLTLKRPLGMTLAENVEKKEVFVESLVEGGNAEATNKIRVGDIISKCSAIVLKSGKEGQFEKEGYGQRPYDNWSTIEFDCHHQDFDTVMAAIDSNNPRWGINKVTLVFRSQ